MANRKKSGAPDTKHFEQSDTIAKFEPVRHWLIKNCKKVSFSKVLNHVIITVILDAYRTYTLPGMGFLMIVFLFNAQRILFKAHFALHPIVHPGRAPQQ